MRRSRRRWRRREWENHWMTDVVCPELVPGWFALRALACTSDPWDKKNERERERG